VPGNMHTCEKSRLHDPHVKALSMPVAAGMRLSLIEYRIDSGDTPEMAVEAISGSFFFSSFILRFRCCFCFSASGLAEKRAPPGFHFRD